MPIITADNHPKNIIPFHAESEMEAMKIIIRTQSESNTAEGLVWLKGNARSSLLCEQIVQDLDVKQSSNRANTVNFESSTEGWLEGITGFTKLELSTSDKIMIEAKESSNRRLSLELPNFDIMRSNSTSIKQKPPNKVNSLNFGGRIIANREQSDIWTLTQLINREYVSNQMLQLCALDMDELHDAVKNVSKDLKKLSVDLRLQTVENFSAHIDNSKANKDFRLNQQNSNKTMRLVEVFQGPGTLVFDSADLELETVNKLREKGIRIETMSELCDLSKAWTVQNGDRLICFPSSWEQQSTIHSANPIVASNPSTSRIVRVIDIS